MNKNITFMSFTKWLSNYWKGLKRLHWKEEKKKKEKNQLSFTKQQIN